MIWRFWWAHCTSLIASLLRRLFALVEFLSSALVRAINVTFLLHSRIMCNCYGRRYCLQLQCILNSNESRDPKLIVMENNMQSNTMPFIYAVHSQKKNNDNSWWRIWETLQHMYFKVPHKFWLNLLELFRLISQQIKWQYVGLWGSLKFPTVSFSHMVFLRVALEVVVWMSYYLFFSAYLHRHITLLFI
jgi:hypothetical protein